MSRLVCSVVATALLAAYGYADISHASYGFGKQYWVTISRNALEKSPSWSEDSDNPPLAAKKAIKLANEMRDTLVNDTKDYKWIIRDVSLVPDGDGKWYWLVNYEARFPFMASGVPPNLRLVVLMDGTVIRPEVKDYP
jgi:hypothetical protein